MILLWGLWEDTPLANVHSALIELGMPVGFVNQRAILQSEIQLSVEATSEGFVHIGDQSIDLGSVTAAYLRPYDSWRIGPVARAGQDSPEYRHALSFDDTLWLWAELTSARVVNRPSAMASNNSKPFQSVQIRSHGFEVPETLITTDPEAVREFWERHGDVIYKSVSGVRSIVSRLRSEDNGRLEDVAWCPTQFQQYVPGTDYRVHVVGDEVFCSKVESEADDYRYGSRQGATVSIERATLPEHWADRCRELTAAMGFFVAGIDLRLTPDGAWYCFEVNPSPAFTYYDRHDQGIGRAVAGLLAAAPGISEELSQTGLMHTSESLLAPSKSTMERRYGRVRRVSKGPHGRLQ